jgi:hypothetical protein
MLVVPTISTKAATLDIRIVDFLVLTQTTLTKVSSGDLGDRWGVQKTRIEALSRLVVAAGLAWTGVLDRVQRAVDLRQKALDLIALMRAGTFLQAIEQLLLSR